MKSSMKEIEIKDIRLLTEEINAAYRIDFTQYALSSFNRRVSRVLELHNIDSVQLLIDKIKSNEDYFMEFLSEITVNVTEMFRDPTFWRVLREKIFPALKRLANGNKISIWHAGCATGEEVFSMGVLLRELKMEDEVQIIASDIDNRALNTARKGIYDSKGMAINKKNYDNFNALGDFNKYINNNDNGSTQMDLSLIKNVSFRNHNLTTGHIGASFDLVLCRNVLIYFNQALQNNVLKTLHSCMTKGGYLSVGSKESLLWCEYFNRYEVIDPEEKIYKKIKE